MKNVLPFLEACNLIVPAGTGFSIQRGQHTPGFAALISEMQSVAREEPEATW